MEELIQFDKQLLLMLNGSDSTFLDGVVLTLTNALTWLPLYLSLLYVVVKNLNQTSNFKKPQALSLKPQTLNLLLILASAGLLVLLAGTVDDEIVKPLVARWRPTHDPEIGSLVDVVNDYRGGRYGFFSAHASNTFSIAVFFSLLIRARSLTIAMMIYSLTNCWTRMYLGVHFPGDITVGLIWGAIVGFSVYMLYRHVRGRWLDNSGITAEGFTSTGYEYRTVYVVPIVLTLTFVYAFVRAWLIMDGIH